MTDVRSVGEAVEDESVRSSRMQGTTRVGVRTLTSIRLPLF